MDSGEKRGKTLKAAALRYNRQKDNIPKLVAKGGGRAAARILELAEEHDIPVTRDPDLLTILSKMDVGECISPALYEVVAELLVFVYRLKEKWQEEHGKI